MNKREETKAAQLDEKEGLSLWVIHWQSAVMTSSNYFTAMNKIQAKRFADSILSDIRVQHEQKILKSKLIKLET